MWQSIGCEYRRVAKRRVAKNRRQDAGATTQDTLGADMGHSVLCPYMNQPDAAFSVVPATERRIGGVRSVMYQWGEKSVLGGIGALGNSN
jgi:hypothetical protein